jgi:hypothetical protein
MTAGSERSSHSITVSWGEADQFLTELDAIAEAIALCGEGAEASGTGGHARAFVALQQALYDRADDFRRRHGLPLGCCSRGASESAE